MLGRGAARAGRALAGSARSAVAARAGAKMSRVAGPGLTPAGETLAPVRHLVKPQVAAAGPRLLALRVISGKGAPLGGHQGEPEPLLTLCERLLGLQDVVHQEHSLDPHDPDRDDVLRLVREEALQ